MVGLEDTEKLTIFTLSEFELPTICLPADIPTALALLFIDWENVPMAI
jgi:hypothetical protein